MKPIPSPFAMTISYPDCDGLPGSDGTAHFDWIRFVHSNLQLLFMDWVDVFVASNLLWYAVEGDPDQRMTPDVMLAFGRPDGDRGSYMQWKENDVPVTVAFEIRSPLEDDDDLARKYSFYEYHGVEEYYVYDYETNKLEIYQRGHTSFQQINDIASYMSRRMGIRFEMTEPEMSIYGSDGNRFRCPVDRIIEARAASARKAEAKRQADEARRETADEAKRADIATRHAARLMELGRKVRRGQATPEEIAELDHLEDESL